MNNDPRAASLEIGERLIQAPSPRMLEVAFAQELKAQLGLAEAVGWVDLAHTLSLAQAGVVPHGPARALVAALLELQAGPSSFTPKPEYGDLYTNREAWLAQATPAVGWLGVARARREALTTAFHIILCDALCCLGAALADALTTLSALSLRHKDGLMPDYTYLQVAQPTTFGHYLQTFASPMLRDLERIMALHARADHCPAGVGGSNGSTIRQDRWGLAKRLGFVAPVRHARDAMWQADLAIEACAVAIAASVNLDRLAEDLMIFASAEFGFVKLADRHARASKIMPQKRNPFALAFVRATANRLIGVQAGVAAAGRTPSGQMDNRLFVYESAPEAARAAAEAASLVAECLAGVEFDEARARNALADRSACAAALAEQLTLRTRIDYRRAHGAVGCLVTQLETQGRSLADASGAELMAVLKDAGAESNVAQLDDILASALDFAGCVASRTDFGGAAAQEVATMAAELAASADERRRQIAATRARRKAAIDALLAEAAAFVAESP